MAKEYKIRWRTRIQSSPPEGLKQSWHEYQVINGRRIVRRFDTQEQCLKFIEEMERK